MARVINNQGTAANVGSSPPSGSDHTHYNTPSTNLTAMSPSQVHGNTPAPKLNLDDAAQAAFSPATTSGRRLVVPVAAESVNLSPTAAEFTPGVRTVVPAAPQAVAPVATSGAQALVPRPTFGAIGQGIPTRVVITDVHKNQFIPLNTNVLVNIGKFSTEDQTARVFQISGVASADPVAVAASFPIREFKSLVQIDSSDMHKGNFRVIFSNIRDARQAFIRAAYTTYPQCQLTFVSPKQLATARGENPAGVTDFAAQLLVTVAPRHPGYEMITIAELYYILSQAGEVYAIQSTGSAGNGPLTFRVEYCDTRVAESALELLNFGDFTDVHLRAASYKPDVNHATGLTVYRAAHERPSLTGRSTLPDDNLMEVEALMARMIVDSPSPTRAFGRASHNQVDAVRIQEGVDVRTTIMLRNIPNKVTQADLKNYLDETSRGDYDFMYLRIDFANNCNVGYAFINFVDPLAIVPFAQARSGVKWNIHDSNKVAEISYATIQGRDCLIQKFRNSSVMLEHPTFRPKLFFAGSHPMAGQEERFPDPDNFSKMRRSIENAEHIGLFRPILGGHKVALAPARVDQDAPASGRTTALVSARAMTAPMVDVHHPNDPFAGAHNRRQAMVIATVGSRTASGLFAPREGQQHREEQRRRRSQFDRGTPGAEYEANAHRLADPALDQARRVVAYQPRFMHALRDRY